MVKGYLVRPTEAPQVCYESSGVCCCNISDADPSRAEISLMINWLSPSHICLDLTMYPGQFLCGSRLVSSHQFLSLPLLRSQTHYSSLLLSVPLSPSFLVSIFLTVLYNDPGKGMAVSYVPWRCNSHPFPGPLRMHTSSLETKCLTSSSAVFSVYKKFLSV